MSDTVTPDVETPADAPPFCYLVVHEACANVLGVFAAQVAHAAQEAVRTLPVDSRTAICVLSCRSSSELEALSTKLTEVGIDHCLNREPDAPWNGAATTLCTTPGSKDVQKPFFTQFKLLRK